MVFHTIFITFFTEDILETISQSTNAYAKRKRMKFEDSVIQPRTWKDTSPAEIKVFLSILIYMGVHRSPRIDYYFRNDLENGPSHLPRLYITQTRFEQLKQFLHISHPESDELRPTGSKDWWHKLEALASRFQEAAQKYYTPGSNLSLGDMRASQYSGGGGGGGFHLP
jgi:hypothetical protein